jgi:hypothetical protein
MNPKPSSLAARLLFAAALSIPGALKAAEITPPAPAPAAPEAAPDQAVPHSAPTAIKYKLPTGNIGHVSNRQSGGTRGAGDKLPSLSVLAPDHIALTTQAQPALFWFQSQPAKAAFQLTLTEPKKAKPLLNVNLDKAEVAGIRAISLSRQGVTLEPGVTYEWHIALIPDPENRSKDVFAGGGIKRIAAPAGLEEKLAKAAPAERAAIYAEAGIWYDALQSISMAIASDPKNDSLHALRVSLLKQAGLAEAAAAEKK